MIENDGAGFVEVENKATLSGWRKDKINQDNNQPSDTIDAFLNTKTMETRVRDNSVDEWMKAYNDLCSEIQVGHYSPKTLKTYSQWLLQFKTFIEKKPLNQLTDDDITAFMKFLAVNRDNGVRSDNGHDNGVKP